MNKGNGRFYIHMGNWLRRVNIFPRLFGSIIILAILPMTFISYFNFYRYVDKIKVDTENFLSLLVGNVSVQVENRFASYEQLSRFFYADGSNMDLLEQNAAIASSDENYFENETYINNKRILSERLYELSGSNSNIASLLFITPYDQYAMTTHDGVAIGGVLKDISSFQESGFYKDTVGAGGYPCWFDTTADRSLIYKDYNSTYGIGGTFTMTVCIYGRKNKELLGVLMCNTDSKFLSESLTSYAFYGTGNTLLLTDQDVIAVLNPNINAPNFDDDTGLQDKVMGKSKGEFTETLQGKKVFVSFKKISRLNLYVLHAVDIDTLLMPAYEIRDNSLLLVAVLFVATVYLSHLTTASITTPLKKLMKSMEKFVENEFSESCEVSGKDELTVVGNHFNQMAKNSQQLLDKILEASLREKTLELSRANAELNALQMQINTHFLYNTLDLIRWEMIRIGGGENEASRMVDTFSNLMRMSIKKDEEMVSVAMELMHAGSYIDVANFRHSRKILFEQFMDFDSEAYLLPKLTLQPLIENSVIHGFTSSMKDCVIQIRGYLEGEDMVIIVADNGKGMTEEEVGKLNQSFAGSQMMQSSIGLRNVNQRIRLYFGGKYGVEIQSELGTGTRISICLSAMTEKLEKKRISGEREGWHV